MTLKITPRPQISLVESCWNEPVPNLYKTCFYSNPFICDGTFLRRCHESRYDNLGQSFMTRTIGEGENIKKHVNTINDHKHETCDVLENRSIPPTFISQSHNATQAPILSPSLPPSTSPRHAPPPPPNFHSSCTYTYYSS